MADSPEDGVKVAIEADPERAGSNVVTLPGRKIIDRTLPQPALVHFKPLGFNRGKFFFITGRGQQIAAFTARELGSVPTLLELAPLDWWEREFADSSGFAGRAVHKAVNALLEGAYARGPFRPNQLRGRGAWWDSGRAVIHAGDGLIVDGQRVPLQGLDSRFVYEAGEPLEIALDEPLAAGEAGDLMRYTHLLEWEQGAIEGTLIAGWVVCALASGALEWRPHGFLTGKSGSGKSTLMQVIQAILGACCVRAKSQETTGSGIRQRLGADVLPVCYDEAEADSERGRQRINEVLALMRAASSDGDGEVLKGSQSGLGIAFAVRSAFLLAAIRVPIAQTADESRITVFSLRKVGAAEQAAAALHYRSNILPLATSLMVPRWGARFRARVFSHLGDLRENARVFGAAAAQHLGSARLGDQLGPLLAGAYLLHRDGVVSARAASAWVARQPWRDQAQIVEGGDEEKLLAVLLEARVKVIADRYTYDASVAELVAFAAKRGYHRAIDAAAAAAELARRGLAVREGYLCVSNTHRGIGELLHGTAWAIGWPAVLRGVEGHVLRGPERYAGALSRGTGIALDVVLGVDSQAVQAPDPGPEAVPWDG